MSELQDKIKTLAEFKGVDPSEVHYEGDEDSYNFWDEFEVDGETYTVMTTDEADQALRDYIENFIDDLGISGFTKDFYNWILENAITGSDYLEDYAREDYQFYAEDIENESGDVGATRLIDECIDAGIISEADLDSAGTYTGDINLVDALAEYLFEDNEKAYGGNWADWYMDNFGKSELDTLVQKGVLDYDLDAIVNEIIDWDGYGNNLARYDGEENELNGFYIFRQD